jgi:hypothetical protein
MPFIQEVQHEFLVPGHSSMPHIVSKLYPACGMVHVVFECYKCQGLVFKPTPHHVVAACVAVAGVSFAWTVIISVMRGALDRGTTPAPTTVQLEEAAAQVAAAVAAEPLATAAAAPAGAGLTTGGTGAAAAAAPTVPAAGAVGHVMPAGEVQSSPSGLKVLLVQKAKGVEATT